MKFISRYLTDYLLSLAVLIAVWMTSIWFLDGFIVWTVFFVALVWAIAYIPFRIRADYMRLKDYFQSIVEFKKGDMSKAEFIDKTVVIACEETGIPESVIYLFIKRDKLDKETMA